MKNAKRPGGCLKNEHAILLQVQCIHTASLFWHTHTHTHTHTQLAQPHPTHQLSSHAKFTQADEQPRPLSAHCAFCVYVCVQGVYVCGCLYCTPMSYAWQDMCCWIENVKDGCDGCENITHWAAQAKSIVETMSRYELSEGVKQSVFQSVLQMF